MADVRESVFENPQFTLWTTFSDTNGRISAFDWQNRGGGTARCRLSRAAGGWDEVLVPPPGGVALLTRAADDGTVTVSQEPLAGSEDGVHLLSVPGGRTYRRDLTKNQLETGDTFRLDVAWTPIRS